MAQRDIAIHRNEPKRIQLAQLPTPIVELKNLAKQLGVFRLLMKRDDLTELEVLGNGSFIGEGYAIPTKEGLDALKLLARREGILLDPTYTSKGIAGFLDTVKKQKHRSDAVPLFVHTGGAFGLMAQRDLFPRA